MVSNLFTKLSQLDADTQQALELDNTNRINELDEQYIELWDQIYSYQPTSQDEAKTMVLLLLNQLTNRAEHGESVVNIRMKILGLYGHQQQSYEQPYLAYGR